MPAASPPVERSTYVVPAPATPEQTRAVLVAALEVLAPAADSAWIDEPAESVVPAGLADALALLRTVAAEQVQEGRLPRSDEPHLGIDLDPEVPERLHLVASLGLLSAAEVYSAAEDPLVVVAGDGTDVRLLLGPDELARVCALLAQRDVPLVPVPAQD